MPLDQQGFDPEFWKAFRAGEEKAFDQVFRHYFGPLSYYAFTIVKDEKLAEDIVQDCFVILWERRKKLTDIKSVNSYLYRCVHNQAVRTLQTMSKKVEINEQAYEESVEKHIIESETFFHLLSLIDHLPDRMKQVLRLYYLEEKTLPEVAEEIGINANTVRTHRYRALQLLKKTIIPG